MSKKIKLLIVASCLCLAATPLLYVGGKGDSSGLMIFGFAVFCVGMAMAPILHLTKNSGVKTPPPDREAAS